MDRKFGLIFLIGAVSLLSSIAPSYAENNLFQHPTGLVDIGKDRNMYMECQGTGIPTVILISGRGDRADIWQRPTQSGLTVFSEVAKFTHVCAYDRPDTVTMNENNVVEPSRSTSVPQPALLKDSVKDLHTLLQKAQVPATYVLVADSYGGLIARLYASNYPGEVAGLVLINTPSELLYDALTPEQQAMWIRLNSGSSPDQEKVDFPSAFQQLREAPPFRQIPTIVITSDQPYALNGMVDKGIIPPDIPANFGSTISQADLNAQQRLIQLLNGKQIKAHAGRYVQLEQPGLVVHAIREVINQVRAQNETY